MDLDLENFFDTVPQDRRMSLVHSIIEDGEMESLIRKYFHSVFSVNGQIHKTLVGTPREEIYLLSYPMSYLMN